MQLLSDDADQDDATGGHLVADRLDDLVGKRAVVTPGQHPASRVDVLATAYRDKRRLPEVDADGVGDDAERLERHVDVGTAGGTWGGARVAATTPRR